MKRQPRLSFRRARGFVLASAIFLLVILASLGAFLVNISMNLSLSSAQDVQGSRAYQAARAGIEWGLYQVLDPTNATVVAPGDPQWPNMPGCAANGLSIEGFAVNVTCQFNDYSEAGLNRRIRVFSLVATAFPLGSVIVGTPGFSERQIQTTVSKCRDVDGSAPSYECP